GKTSSRPVADIEEFILTRFHAEPNLRNLRQRSPPVIADPKQLFPKIGCSQRNAPLAACVDRLSPGSLTQANARFAQIALPPDSHTPAVALRVLDASEHAPAESFGRFQRARRRSVAFEQPSY